MVRCVIDPGVLIAARLSGRGAPAELIRRWIGGQVDIIVSPMLLTELHTVLLRDKFRRWLTVEEADLYVHLLRTRASVFADPPAETGHCRDVNDDYLVTLARAAHAHILVSGDPDLLEIPDPQPAVMTPRQLVDRLDQVR